MEFRVLPVLVWGLLNFPTMSQCNEFLLGRKPWPWWRNGDQSTSLRVSWVSWILSSQFFVNVIPAVDTTIDCPESGRFAFLVQFLKEFDYGSLVKMVHYSISFQVVGKVSLLFIIQLYYLDRSQSMDLFEKCRCPVCNICHTVYIVYEF